MTNKAYVKPSPDQVRQWVENRFPYRIRKSKKRGDIYLIDSPFIPGDSGWHVAISPSECWVRDFRPQYSALHKKSILGFVADVEGVSFAEAVKIIFGKDASYKAILAQAQRELAKETHPEPEEPAPKPTNKLPDGLHRVDDKTAQAHYPKSWQSAINYLNSRGITIEEAIKYGVLYDATSILFCYYEYGQMVYWQRRDLINKKFEFPPTSNEFLWGFDYVEPNGVIYIVESIFNASSIGPGAVATGGALLKERQLRLIKMLRPSKIILAPDNDEAGLAGLRKQYFQLAPYFPNGLYYYLSPKGKDLNDMAKEMDRLNNRDVVRNIVNLEAKKLTKLDMLRLTMRRAR